MTCKTLEPQSPSSQTCGGSEKAPNKMEQMMRKMLAGCGSMMAEKMQEAAPCEGEHLPGGGSGQQPPVTRSMTSCGCAPIAERMLSKRCGVGTTRTSEHD
jgi:hypothetical protein